MRFSISAALATALLATDATAWHSKHRQGWRWSRPSQVQNGGVVYKTVTLDTPAVPTTMVKQTKTSAPVTVEVTTSAPAATSASAATSAPASDSPSSSGLDADQKAALDAHNAARSEVGQTALTWDDSLAKDAQEWADHLVSVGSLTHSQGSGQGENLYMQSGGSSPFASAAKMWIAEKSSYDGQAVGDGDFGSYGHYSELSLIISREKKNMVC